CRRLSRSWNRSTVRIKTTRPTHLDEWLAEKKLSCCTIQHIKKAVSVRPEHDFPRRSLPRHVSEYRNLHRVVVRFVVRRNWEMPFQLAGIRIECDNRIAVQIVAAAVVTVVIRTWVADAPIREVCLRVIGASDPNRCSAMLPGVFVPSFVSRLAWSRNRIEAPCLFSCFHVIGCQESSDAVFTTGRTDDNFVFHHQGRERQRIACSGTCNGYVPKRMAIFRIDSYEMRVNRRHEQRVTR